MKFNEFLKKIKYVGMKANRLKLIKLSNISYNKDDLFFLKSLLFLDLLSCLQY